MTGRSFPATLRLGTGHRRALYATFLGTWISGLLWLSFHYFFATEGEFGPTPHILETWWLRLHGLSAFVFLIAFGSVLPIHARRAWQLDKNRATGLAMKGVVTWLAATGYALYYFAAADNEAWLPLLHWSVGLALPLILAYHVRRGRARARAGAGARAQGEKFDSGLTRKART